MESLSSEGEVRPLRISERPRCEGDQRASSKRKIALITGITGQDGACLAEFLLGKDYVVHGIRRRTSLFNTKRIDHLYEDEHHPSAQVFLHHGDMTDTCSLARVI